MALGVKEEEGEAFLEVKVLLDPRHLPLVLKEHAGKVAELPVHHPAVAPLAVKVLLAGELGKVEQGLSALDVAVVGADAHRAPVEVDVAVEVEQAVTEHQVDRECVCRGAVAFVEVDVGAFRSPPEARGMCGRAERGVVGPTDRGNPGSQDPGLPDLFDLE